MERWTQKRMDEHTSLEFAKEIVHERYVPLNHYSPLATKLNKTELDLKRLIQEEYQNKGNFTFTIRVNRNDVIRILGKEKAEKFTDNDMETLVDRLQTDYNMEYIDSSLKRNVEIIYQEILDCSKNPEEE